LVDEKAVQCHPKEHSIDLFNAIKEGNFPKFVLFIQAISTENTEFIKSLPFDILDATKEWPINLIPLREVGVLEFNRNPKNSFTENEVMAFSPGRLVPGIEPSNDKLLQGRLFSYNDAQRYRLSSNFQLLPVNAPLCPFFNGNVDGLMNFNHHPSSRVINYFPSLVSANLSQKPTIEAPKCPHDSEYVTGKIVRESVPNSEADYSQAGARYRAFDEDRKERFAERIALTLLEPGITDLILLVWIDRHWKAVDGGLPAKIRKYMSYYGDQKLMQEDSKWEQKRLAFEKANGGPMPLSKEHASVELNAHDSKLATFSASH
jgi:catalase